eukprot:IDg892t1
MDNLTAVSRLARDGMLVLTILLVFAAQASSHSYLLTPHPDWRNPWRAHCRRGGPAGEEPDNCPGPCIPWESEWFVNRTAPTTEWSRGQRVRVSWARNGHRNGFVRLALVPRADRMNLEAHARGTFHYACWDGNQRACDAERYNCGTDIYTYETNATVPALPDDYWSCANIRVRGGEPVDAPSTPLRATFAPGNHKGTCTATTNIIGECQVEPCPDSDVPGGRRELRPYGFYDAKPMQAPRASVSPARVPSGVDRVPAHVDPEYGQARVSSLESTSSPIIYVHPSPVASQRAASRNEGSVSPTWTPSVSPSVLPTRTPSVWPTRTPSVWPTRTPSVWPTRTPSVWPTHTLSVSPT